MITIDQIRAGRAMARLTQAQLAAQAGISTTAMNNIEHGTDAKGSTLRAIQAALEKVGIEFDADGRGVRLKPAQVFRSRHVRTLHPKLYVARTGRALPAHPACAKLAAPIQHRPNNGDRRSEIGGNRPRACPDALGPHSRLAKTQAGPSFETV